MKRRSKFILIFLVLILGGVFIYYTSLKTRHQELIKSKIYYTLGLVDSEWKTNLTNNSITFTTPTFVISNIYKSMEGPKSDQFVVIDDTTEELLWLTSFKTNAVSSNEQYKMSNDFVCHTNFEYRDAEHYNRWNLTERINSQYPRITSISNGVEAFELPDGFGFPVFSNERLFINAQALNHNITDSTFNIKHQIKIGFTKNKDKALVPLQPKTVFMMFPYDPQNPFQGPTEQIPNACIPVETKNHSYLDNDGNALSGHWIISPGKHSYTYNASQQLQIKDSIRLHQITSHLHPFANRFKLRDKTTGDIIYDCNSENYTNKIGLKNTPSFSSQKGIWMYHDHTYEMLLEVNNTTDNDQEMMASMAIFYYDAEMENKIKALKL
ncbi:hypothetical protein [Psychroserpens damuponensis]|uniref:hypothetical protein n=1 Tax=Psychroserpens damuponensis TaxID=943936 RepID=UPI00058FDD1C|nr:hypothetical protein [Psychroserpens damuponensis]